MSSSSFKPVTMFRSALENRIEDARNKHLKMLHSDPIMCDLVRESDFVKENFENPNAMSMLNEMCSYLEKDTQKTLLDDAAMICDLFHHYQDCFSNLSLMIKQNNEKLFENEGKLIHVMHETMWKFLIDFRKTMLMFRYSHYQHWMVKTTKEKNGYGEEEIQEAAKTWQPKTIPEQIDEHVKKNNEEEEESEESPTSKRGRKRRKVERFE